MRAVYRRGYASVSRFGRDGILRWMHTLLITLAAHLSVVASVFSFFSGLLENVQTAFRHYGYLIIFLPILGESAGIPLPGETVLLAGGLAASKGILSLPLVILVGASRRHHRRQPGLPGRPRRRPAAAVPLRAHPACQRPPARDP